MDSIRLLLHKLSLLQSALMSDQSASVINIAKAGDVFLIVGTEKLKLRVRSLILKATSKPFAAMLGPNWMQGREQPSPENPMEITLPEDNAVSLKYICAVTHPWSKMILKFPSSQEILEIAITTDKYDFFDAVELATRYWLLSCGKDAAASMALMTAACLFRNAPAFNKNAKALVLDYSGSYLDLYTEQIEHLLDWRVIYWLEEQRNHARLQLGDILLEGSLQHGHCKQACKWRDKHAFAYMKSLKEGHLWPGELLGVTDSMKRVAKIPSLQVDQNERVKDSCMYQGWHGVPANFHFLYHDKLKKLEDSSGLCLQCVESNCLSPGCCHTAH